MSGKHRFSVKTGLNISIILILIMPAAAIKCAVHPRYTGNDSRPLSNSAKGYSRRKTNQPENPKKFIQTGTASYYGPGFHGKKTANGERFNMYKLTAAHRTLPFGTKLKVTNIGNGKYVKVRVNDRGPYKKKRIIDLSKAAAEKIGMTGSGTAEVKLEVIR